MSRCLLSTACIHVCLTAFNRRLRQKPEDMSGPIRFLHRMAVMGQKEMKLARAEEKRVNEERKRMQEAGLATWDDDDNDDIKTMVAKRMMAGQ